MALQVRATGAASGGGTTNPLGIAKPAGTTNGDLLVAVIEYATGAGTNHVTATGWTETAWRDQVAATGRTDLAIMTRIADGSEAATVDFTVAGTINHRSGRMTAIQDHGLASVADIVASASNGGAASTTGTALGITVEAGSLILVVGGLALDAVSTAAYSAWTNSNIASINSQEIMDNIVNTGNGGGFGAAWGICAGTTTGNTTWTQTSEAWNGFQLGIKPAAAGATNPGWTGGGWW